MKQIIVLVSLLLMVSYAAFAEMTCGHHSCTGVPYQVIQYKDGGVAIYPTSGNMPSVVTCDARNGGKAMFILPTTAKEPTMMYSMLLMVHFNE